MSPLSNAVSTHSVVTAFVLLLNSQVLAHNHVHLSDNDLGLLLLLVNSAAHGLRPLLAGLYNKLLARVSK